MNIYKYLDYKSFLRDTLLEKKRHISQSFTYERMAKACGVQKTYLSRVLNSADAHLSEDQLFAAAAYLGMKRNEQRYLQLLRMWQKSQHEQLKADLFAQIQNIRDESDRSERFLNAESTTTPTSDLSGYYLDPNSILVHMFLSVERFAKNRKLLAQALHLTDEHLAEILVKLESLGLIKFGGDAVVLIKESLHLPVDSALYGPYRLMNRLKSLERIQYLSRERSYNFSVTFSADEDARRKIKSLFLNFLNTVQKAAMDAPKDEVYQMNFDLFDWSLGN